MDYLICKLWGRLDCSGWHFDDPYSAWVLLLRQAALDPMITPLEYFTGGRVR